MTLNSRKNLLLYRMQEDNLIIGFKATPCGRKGNQSSNEKSRVSCRLIKKFRKKGAYREKKKYRRKKSRKSRIQNENEIGIGQCFFFESIDSGFFYDSR